MSDTTNIYSHIKIDWEKPKFLRLGNLKEFVQTGNAFGKSGICADGSSMPGGETKPPSAGSCKDP